MAKISKLEPGQTVWSVESQRMGNTTARRKALYSLKIVEIDTGRNMVLASWNNNKPQWWNERTISKWKIKKPEPKGSFLGMPTY